MDKGNKRPTMDPMQNDLVLERIFEFCNVPSLKNCRLVSTKWRDCSLKAWRAKAVIQLGPEQKLEFGAFLGLINSDENEDSLQLRRYPFKRYTLEFLEDEDYEEQKQVAALASNSGARHVKIDWRSDNISQFEELLSTLTTESLESLEVSSSTFYDAVPSEGAELNSPNLKRLRLFTSHLNGPAHYPEHILWPYMLNTFSFVEALSIGYDLRGYQNDEDYLACLKDRWELARFLMNIRILFTHDDEAEDEFNLKELDMYEVYTNQKISQFTDQEGMIIMNLALCQFPLERLSIYVGWIGVEKSLLVFMLTQCQETLQYLKASIHFSKTLLRMHYDEERGRIARTLKPEGKLSSTVCMQQLKEVWLVNGLEWAMYVLANLQLPRLEKLKVEYDQDRNSYIESEKYPRQGLVSCKVPPGIIYERLETFELLDNLCIPGPDLIRKFAKMMPNLAHLTIPLDKRSFTVVCEQFKGLKTLNVLCGQGTYVELDDEGLTGISQAQAEKDGGHSSRRPNITDLKHLTDLSILCDRQLKRDDVKFTEHSVIHGFLQLERLYYLSIALREISVEMKDRLLDHVKGCVKFQEKWKDPPTEFVIEIVSDDEDEASGEEDAKDNQLDTK